jgi:hypothetical protein
VVPIWPSLDADEARTIERPLSKATATAPVAHATGTGTDPGRLLIGWTDGLLEARDSATGVVRQRVHAHDASIATIASTANVSVSWASCWAG